MEKLTYAQTKGIVEALRQVDREILKKVELVDAAANLDLAISDAKYDEILTLLADKYDWYRGWTDNPVDIYDFVFAVRQTIEDCKDLQENGWSGTEADLDHIDWCDVLNYLDD